MISDGMHTLDCGYFSVLLKGPEFDQVLMDMLKNTVVLDRHGLAWFRSHLTEYSLFVRINGMQVNRVQ